MEDETNLSLQSILGEYEHYLKQGGKEPSTIKIYVLEVKHFFQELENNRKRLHDIRQEDILHSRDEKYGKGMKDATINKSISILSTFFKWAKQKGIVSDNYAENLRLLETHKTREPKWLAREEEAALIAYAAKERNAFKRSRNEALIHTMLYAGLRVEEVSHLRLDSVGEHKLTIEAEHGRPSREVPIGEESESKIKEWMHERSLADKSEYKSSPFLFVTERSGHMQPRSIQFVVEGYSEKLGFPLTTIRLRHTYCYRLVERGASAAEIGKLAGHKSILTTWQYFT